MWREKRGSSRDEKRRNQHVSAPLAKVRRELAKKLAGLPYQKQGHWHAFH